MAGRSEAVTDASRPTHGDGDMSRPARDDSTGDDDGTVQLLAKYAPPAYDPNLRVSSSLGHLQLECVPEDMTELEEEAEVESRADEMNDGEKTSAPSASESCTAAAAAATDVGGAVSTDDGEKCTSASLPQTDTADMSLHVESKPLLYFVELPAISRLTNVFVKGFLSIFTSVSAGCQPVTSVKIGHCPNSWFIGHYS